MEKPIRRRRAGQPAQDSEPSSNGATLAGLFLGGLVLRLVHVWTVRESPLFTMPMLDPAMYDEWARALLAGRPPGGVFFQDPLYAYVLAGLYRTLGDGPLVVAIVQSILGAAVAPLVFVAARPSFGVATAGTAGSLAALYAPAIYYDGMLLKTSLAVFWVAVLLAVLARVPWSRPLGLYAVAGALLGLGALTRGNLRLMIPLVALWVWLESPGAGGDTPPAWRTGWRQPARRAAAVVFLSAAVVVLLPAAVRNRIVGGEWVLTTANVGQNLYLGNNPLNETGEYPRLPFVDPNPKHEQRDFAAEAARRIGRPPTAREASRFWQGEAVDWITSHPDDWLRLLWKKLRVYWGAYEVPDNTDFYLYRERAPVLRLPLPGFGLLAPFGLLGLVLAWRRRGWPRLAIWFVAGYSASVVAFFVFSRFRMPMMPALYVLAAHAVVEIVRCLGRARVDRTRRARAALLVAGWLALVAFVHLPLRGRADSLAAALAGASGLPFRLETSATARFNLGVVYAARAADAADASAWLRRAEEQLRLAWAEEPRFASIPIELGKVLARQRREAEAVEVYRAALALEPGNHRIHHALGLLAERMADEQAAETAFRRALELEPRHVASAVHLGESLLRQGRVEEARAAFAHAARLAPENERARSGLRRSREGR